MSYTRFTQGKITKDNTVLIRNEHGDILMSQQAFDMFANAYNRLAELEDKIEQGTLIELDMKLPFKVGKTAYWLNGLPNCIQEYKVLGYSFDCFCGLRVDLGSMQPILFRCFGRKLFASREEAEKRLLELQGG